MSGACKQQRSEKKFVQIDVFASQRKVSSTDDDNKYRALDALITGVFIWLILYLNHAIFHI